MRNPQIVTLVLVFGFLVPVASAHKGTWQAVENLPPGTPISVKSRRFRRMCTFVRATDDELVCEPLPRPRSPYRIGPRQRPFPLPPLPWPDELAFERKDVSEVRLEHSVATNEFLGAAVFGGAGAALGASNNNGTLTRGGGALLGGLLGGLIGGVFGRDFPLFHRKVIYKRGDDEQRKEKHR